jgi:peptide/nickel transport system substrate-binding protein
MWRTVIFSVWDPQVPGGPPTGQPYYQFESLVGPSATVNPDDWSFNTLFAAPSDCQGYLAESWEEPDPLTFIFHLHKGIHWPNMPPANGREITANDIVFHYARFFGWSGGKPSPQAGWLNAYQSVTATDDYTVEVKLNKPGFNSLMQVFDPAGIHYIECPEAVQQGIANDWHYALGTGPFYISDFVDGASLTYSRNPDYWGYDERHPQNRLPYADTLKLLIIPDRATGIAALRTGKLDLMESLNWMEAQSLARTNPELKQDKLPQEGPGIDLRINTKPFSDINVRKALELAIDRQALAKSQYGGVVDGTPAGILSPALKGWAYDYKDWPQSLKDEYSYNPQKAKQLLAEAGYPNGFKTDIVAPTNTDLQFLQAIKSYFMDIGVDMAIDAMDPTAARNIGVALKWDAMYYMSPGSTTGPTRSPQNCINIGYSGDKELNWAGVNDPNYDVLYNQFLSATNDQQAMEAFRQADKIAIEQHWRIHTFSAADFTVYQPYLKGYTGERLTFWDRCFYPRMWIDSNLKKSMGR